jgi:Fe2+ transport system protein FeoA
MVSDLPSLKAGDRGTVAAVRVSAAAAKRLADMGFVRGARLEMVKPGCPCIVRIGGTCVGLGAGHQPHIQLHVPDCTEVDCPARAAKEG